MNMLHGIVTGMAPKKGMLGTDLSDITNGLSKGELIILLSLGVSLQPPINSNFTLEENMDLYANNYLPKLLPTLTKLAKQYGVGTQVLSNLTEHYFSTRVSMVNNAFDTTLYDKIHEILEGNTSDSNEVSAIFSTVDKVISRHREHVKLGHIDSHDVYNVIYEELGKRNLGYLAQGLYELVETAITNAKLLTNPRTGIHNGVWSEHKYHELLEENLEYIISDGPTGTIAEETLDIIVERLTRFITTDLLAWS